ncbi:Pectinesterase [Rhynchospora pubera]|uniref:Pectinesterase n=1 Tax=Rhynchospora pubera TaxID=906938 RepID=A0AAV8CD03_9POAL|nr:Pectinesterase [Rhynchospora pubera]
MGNKKGVIIGGGVIVLVAVVAAVAVISTQNGKKSSGSSDSGQLSSSVKSIKDFCQPTDYQKTCESALQQAAVNVSSPTELAQAIFNVTSERIALALNKSATLTSLANDPRTSGALENCKELLQYAIEDIKTSFEKLGGFEMTNFQQATKDLKTWLSAALTYQDTCLEGFENTTGDASQKMQESLQSTKELTTNILALVDEFSKQMANLDLSFLDGNNNNNKRRLLEEGEAEISSGDIPSWLPESKRSLLATAPAKLKPNLTVAQDGSGDFKTIKEALTKVPPSSAQNFVIYIKQGTYKEYISVGRTLTNVVMYGDGPTKTVISGNKNFMMKLTTKDTATFEAIGNGFFARDLAIENTAGAQNHQAVALRVQSDFSVFYNCQFNGYQDTLYTHANRQFYRECTISGTIDFIFGNAQVIFQNCLLLVRKPMDNQQNIVTAQGRGEPRSAGGTVIHNCTVSADASLKPVQSKIQTYLGRPWREYSRTFYIQSQIDDVINPVGWLPWAGDFGINTCFYAELENRGAGSDTSKRATWKGVKKITYADAQAFTVEHFIQGSQWIPKTGVTYIPGLLPQSEGSRIHK